MHYDCYLFSMSMLIFIEDNKRNKCGGEFSIKLKIFKILAFLHSMHDLIFKPYEQQHDF